MFTPSADVARSTQRKGLRQSVGAFSLGPSLEGAEGLRALCTTFLKGSEGRGVRRDMHDSGAGRLPQLARPGRVRARDVVEHDEGARAQAGDEPGRAVPRQARRVDGPGKRQGCANAVPPPRADNREVAAVRERCGAVGPLATGGAGRGARQRQGYAAFVQDDPVCQRQPLVLLWARGPRVGVGWGRARGLFVRARPSACSPRQRGLRLTLPRACFASCARSSARVASGVAATRSGTGSRGAAESFALAPPPCGHGALSPRSRCWRNRLYMKDAGPPNTSASFRLLPM